ncbi:tetratricopeptide repeat protein [Sphingobacterium sp. 2149]|uniref:tetratricopeptide repeat protein n=1 Tax=Sphingobacterium sp. 2149 TaxID=2817763 RepID=UPI001AE471C4|nr:tetratricopeptide repeat protein [Sphingobacterium sp. 2149]MDR6733728.1 YaiO family outer membrane protein [Sphingobacterium sp. 2149]
MNFRYPIFILLLLSTQLLRAQTWNSVRAEKLYQQAVIEIKSSQQHKALKSLEDAIKLNPAHIDAQVQLARIYMAQKRYDQSIRTAQLVLRASPGYEDVYYYIIGSYLSKNRPGEALRYVEMGLSRFAANKDFGIKKLNILDMLKRYQDGDSWAEVLMRRFPTDRNVRLAMAGHYEAKADWYKGNRMDNLANSYYEKALELAPKNTDLIEKMNNLVSQGGDYDARIARVNALLNSDSKSYNALFQKLSLLQESHRYAEALDVIRVILRYYPKDKKALDLNNSLRKEAAGYYQNTDTYALYQSILDQNPGDREALEKVVGIAASRGETTQALYWVDRALQRNIGDRVLLRRKMDFEYQLHRYQAAADIAVKLYGNNSDKAFRSEAIQMINACGHYYLQQQQADSAMVYYDRTLGLEPKNMAALQGRISALLVQNNMAEALRELDQAISYYPNDIDLQLKKAGFLAQSGKIQQAVALSEKLYVRYPENSKLKSLYLEQQLAAANACILVEEYGEAETHLRQLLGEDPDNKEALHYLSNILDLRRRYPEALLVVQRSLQSYPGDRDFLQKKASILYNSAQYMAAAEVATMLRTEYPYNQKYRGMVQDAWMAAGLVFQKKALVDSAIFCYNRVLEGNRTDSLAHMNKIGLLMGKGDFAYALRCVDTALQRFEYAEPFLLKKVIVLDSLGRFAEAAQYADTLSKRFDQRKHREYAAFLRSKTMQHAFGLSLLNSSFSGVDDNPAPPAYRIATLYYTRRLSPKISYGAQLLFTGRQSGTGIMGEGDLTYTASKLLYWKASIGISNNVLLPKYRLAYSLYRQLGKGFEGEIGTRFLEVVEVKALSLVAGVSKSFAPFLLNARIFAIKEEKDFYLAFQAGAKYELTEADLLQANFGMGTSPDDRSRLILLPELGGVMSRSLGAGYRRTINYRTSLGLNGTYTSQKIGTATFRNQYDLLLALQVKF